MKAIRHVILGVLVVLMGVSPSLAQMSKSPLLTTFPGWGVQAWVDTFVGFPEGVIAEAFHFSPDGSYYHVQDEGTILRIAVTFDAKVAISKHPILIDATGVANVFLDGVPLVPWVNDEHRVVELYIPAGRHTLMIVNNSYIENANIGLMVVGKCLWGTDNGRSPGRPIHLLRAARPRQHLDP